MPRFNVWMEGFAATGESGPAQFLGFYEAKSFEEACHKAAVKMGMLSFYTPAGKRGYKVPSIWGCRCFDNEVEAREAFG